MRPTEKQAQLPHHKHTAYGLALELVQLVARTRIRRSACGRGLGRVPRYLPYRAICSGCRHDEPSCPRFSFALTTTTDYELRELRKPLLR